MRSGFAFASSAARMRLEVTAKALLLGLLVVDLEMDVRFAKSNLGGAPWILAAKCADVLPYQFQRSLSIAMSAPQCNRVEERIGRLLVSREALREHLELLGGPSEYGNAVVEASNCEKGDGIEHAFGVVGDQPFERGDARGPPDRLSRSRPRRG